MPPTQNPDGTWTRTPSGRKAKAQGNKQALGAGLVHGYTLGQMGKQNVVGGGKHAHTLYGPGGFYSKNFAGAREGWQYDWRTGMKMNMSSPDNPAFHKWVPVEPWEMKRHNNMQAYLAQNPSASAADYTNQLWPRKGGYNAQGVGPGGQRRNPRNGKIILGDPVSSAVSSGGRSMAFPQGTLGSLAAGGYTGTQTGLPTGPGGPNFDNYLHQPRGRSRRPMLNTGTGPTLGSGTLTNPLSSGGGVLGGISLGRRRGPGRPGGPGAPGTNPPYMNDPEGFPYAPGPQPGEDYNPGGSGPTFDDYWDQFRRWAGGGR